MRCTVDRLQYPNDLLVGKSRSHHHRSSGLGDIVSKYPWLENPRTGQLNCGGGGAFGIILKSHHSNSIYQTDQCYRSVKFGFWIVAGKTSHYVESENQPNNRRYRPRRLLPRRTSPCKRLRSSRHQTPCFRI